MLRHVVLTVLLCLHLYPSTCWGQTPKALPESWYLNIGLSSGISYTKYNGGLTRGNIGNGLKEQFGKIDALHLAVYQTRTMHVLDGLSWTFFDRSVKVKNVTAQSSEVEDASSIGGVSTLFEMNYFFDRILRGPFIAGGIGVSNIVITKERDTRGENTLRSDWGPAFKIGGGYAFERNKMESAFLTGVEITNINTRFENLLGEKDNWGLTRVTGYVSILF